MKAHLVLRVGVAVSIVATIAGCAVDSASEPAPEENIGQTTQALTVSHVSNAAGSIGGLVQSTGNLYWTANDYSDIPLSYGARVHRAGKTSTPGLETTLYQESSTSFVQFGDITYANPGTFYGYFTANYSTGSQIKRVPLSGGPATVLASSSAQIGGLQTLDNDGSYLYWADVNGLRKMPIGGGAVTTLATVSNIQSVGLDAANVYFIFGSVVYSVPKAGGALTWHASGLNTLNALHVAPGSPTTLYWAERGGRIAKKPVGGAVQVLHTMSGSYDAQSVSFDGSRLLWTECTAPGNSTCWAYSKLGAAAPISTGGGVYARMIQGDPAQMFWAGGGRIFRAVY